jgi:hypothetical protein
MVREDKRALEILAAVESEVEELRSQAKPAAATDTPITLLSSHPHRVA